MGARRLVIVSGVSGSGKSTALKAFEDMGFVCVDNLPAPLITPFVELLLGAGPMQSSGLTLPKETADEYALLVDCRDEQSFAAVQSAMQRLGAVGMDCSLLFFDCLDEVIVRRFRETRRPHPLLLSKSYLKTIAEAITKERELLADFREIAACVIDTSSFTPHELRRRVEEYCGRETALRVFLLSFGYKYGAPYDADLLIDVRFLPNPHFIPELKPLTGQDQEVISYVFAQKDTEEFITHYLGLLDFLIPRYRKEGKRYLTIGIGCTGGQHRSVAISERIGKELSQRGLSCTVNHRDLPRVKPAQ